MDEGKRMILLGVVVVLIGSAFVTVSVAAADSGGLESMREYHDAVDVELHADGEGGLLEFHVGDRGHAVGSFQMLLVDGGVAPGDRTALFWVMNDPESQYYMSSLEVDFVLPDGSQLLNLYPGGSMHVESEGIVVDVLSDSDLLNNQYGTEFRYHGQSDNTVVGPIGSMTFRPGATDSFTGTVTVTYTELGLLPESHSYTYDVTVRL